MSGPAPVNLNVQAQSLNLAAGPSAGFQLAVRNQGDPNRVGVSQGGNRMLGVAENLFREGGSLNQYV